MVAGKRSISCLKCHAEFKRKREWQRFCSAGCRIAYHNNVTTIARKAWLHALDAAEASISDPPAEDSANSTNRTGRHT